MTDLVFSGMKVIVFQRLSEITVSYYDFFNVFEAENISDEEKIVSIFKSASDSLVK